MMSVEMRSRMQFAESCCQIAYLSVGDDRVNEFQRVNVAITSQWPMYVM